MLNVRAVSLQVKLIFSVLLLAILTGAAGISGLYYINKVRTTTTVLTDFSIPLVASLNRLTKQARETQDRLDATLRIWSPDNQKKAKQIFAELDASSKMEFQKIANLAEKSGQVIPINDVKAVKKRFMGKANSILDAYKAREKVLLLGREIEESMQEFIRQTGALDKILAGYVSERGATLEELRKQSNQLASNEEGDAASRNSSFAKRFAKVFPEARAAYQVRVRMTVIKNLAEQFLNTNKPRRQFEIEQRLSSTIKSARGSLKTIEKTAHSSGDKKALSEIDRSLQVIEELLRNPSGVFANHRALLRASSFAEMHRILLHREAEDYERELSVLLNIANSIIVRSRANARDVASSSENSILLIVFASILLALIFIFLVYQTVSRPLAHITEKMHRLAAGELDIHIAHMDDKDEIGALARALGVFRENAIERLRLEDIQAEQAERVIRYARKAARAEEMEAALEKEKQLTSMQREFVSMASHEFRTPLAIIDSSAQRLLRKSGKNILKSEDIKAITGKIRGAIQRITRLMESMLSSARMEQGKVELKIEECDIGKLISDTCSLQSEVSESHNIICELKDLPSYVYADADGLGQILTNLLSNAVKYSPEHTDVCVVAYTEGDYVIISVKDQGFGIDKEDLEKVGERFFRARTSYGIEGSGIGLNVVKMLIEEHHGDITVESTKGEGSTFTVRLPITGPVTENEQIFA